MSRPSHYGVVFCIYAPLAFLLTYFGYYPSALIGVFLVVLLVRAPDIDLRLPYLEHRGLTHTVWFAVLVGLALAYIFSQLAATGGQLSSLLFAGSGFLLGAGAIGAHLVVDSLSPAGIAPFAPFNSETYSYRLTRANNPLLNYCLLFIGGGLLAGAFILGFTL